MPFRKRSELLSICLLALVTQFALLDPSLGQEPPQASPTTWVNPEGKALEANFVRLEEGAVVLQLKTTGKEVRVPLSALSLESHLQALKLADPQAFSKPLIKAPEKPVIEEFVPEFTLTGEELLKSPFSNDPTIEQFLDTAIAEIERGNQFVFWHAMPPKMQSDMEDVIVKAMGKLGPQPLAQIKSMMKSLNTIVREKRDFILAYPDIASQPQLVADLEKNWPATAGVVGIIADESNWEFDNFQNGKLVPWMADFMAKMAPYYHEQLKQAKESAGLSSTIPYKIISQSADMAEVEFTVGQGVPPQTLRFQKVGDIWLVPSFMNSLREGLDQVSKQLDQAFDPAPVSFVLLGVNAAVGSVDRAKTQEEFNAAVDQLKNLPGLAGGMGGPPQASTQNSSGGGQPPRTRTPSASVSGAGS